MHPSQLVDRLRAYHPRVGLFAPSHVHAYADLMLKLSAQSGRRHRSAGQREIPHEALSIYCRKLRKSFGVDGFRELNDLLECIASSRGWDVENKETKAYWLTGEGKRMIESARQEALKGAENYLLDGRGNQVRKRKNGVYTARDNQNRNAVTDAKLEWAVPVNLEAISMVLDIGVGKFFPDVSLDRVARTDTTLRAIHACALNDNVGRGLIPQVYKEATSGRLYGTGELSLQSVTREAKRVALLGAHEYDFINCHYRLLHNYAQGQQIDTPATNEYLDNPRAFRQSLADELSITYQQAKECLIAIIFGATRSYWADCAIPALIGPEKAELLYELPQFDELSFEVVEVGERMRADAPRLPNGAIVNCRKKACIGNPRQELAHLLQGLESHLLHCVIAEYGDDILIIQHDGFTASRHIEPNEIEALISYQTGIEMPVSYEALTLSGSS
jgi:hypothetical protein